MILQQKCSILFKHTIFLKRRTIIISNKAEKVLKDLPQNVSKKLVYKLIQIKKHIDSFSLLEEIGVKLLENTRTVFQIKISDYTLNIFVNKNYLNNFYVSEIIYNKT